jgi:hypothetical protein
MSSLELLLLVMAIVDGLRPVEGGLLDVLVLELGNISCLFLYS